MTDALPNLAAMVALLVANAFFVIAEYAIVSMRRSRVEQLVEQGSRAGRLLLRAKDDPSRFISAVQLGVTMASLGLGWVGESAIAALIDPLFAWIPATLQGISVHSVAVLLAFGLISGLHIVLGEQVPKMLALQYTERAACWTIIPLQLFYWIFRPFIWLFSLATAKMLRLLRIPEAAMREAPISAEELELLVETSHKAGVLEASERELLTNVFDFSDLTVRQVMVPRADVVAVSVDSDLDAVLDVCDASPHSRILVYEGSVDEIVGVIHLKDLLRGVRSPGRQFDLRSSMHEPRFVPESMEVARLLEQFKRHRSTIAVVVDEFGGTAGLVTLDDLVDELLGDVPDELDVARGGVEQLSETTWRLSPRLRIDELEAMVGEVIPDTEEAETVSGLLQERLGRIAVINDAVELPGHVLTVEGVDGVRITSLRLERRGQEQEDGNA